MNKDYNKLSATTLYHRGGKMPFKSKAQRRFMYAKHPKIAKRWSKKYGKGKNLPEKKGTVKGY